MICLLLFFVQDDVGRFGICSGCGASARILYPFFHGNAFHLAINIFVFLQAVFLADVSFLAVLLSWIIASTVFPVTWSTPTVGLSGVIYALFGIITWRSSSPLFFVSCTMLYVAIGLLNPASNTYLHLYSYAVGLLVGILGKPVE